jgi:hypothetical protein
LKPTRHSIHRIGLKELHMPASLEHHRARA